jgi:hypothetical protein
MGWAPRSVALAIALSALLWGSSHATTVLADHYGIMLGYTNTYTVGTSIESSYNAGQLHSACNAHWRYFAKVSVMGYSTPANPWINYVRLHDGTNTGGSAVYYGDSYLVSDTGSIGIPNFLQSIYPDRYYFIFDWLPSTNGDFSLYAQVGTDPGTFCTQGGYHLYDRVS